MTISRKEKEKEKQLAIQRLGHFIKEGDEIYTINRYFSRSGMLRVLSFYVVRANRIMDITIWVCQAIDEKYNHKHEGMTIRGYGMDFGHFAVMCLSRVLFDNDRALTQRWL